jgi:hypothetical protein
LRIAKVLKFLTRLTENRMFLIVNSGHPANYEVRAERNEQRECAEKQYAASDLQAVQIAIETPSATLTSKPIYSGGSSPGDDSHWLIWDAVSNCRAFRTRASRSLP